MAIRAKTFRAWLSANLDKGQLRDLAEQGAPMGFPGLTYYKDTAALYDKFHEEIWSALDDDASGMGHKNILEMLGTFGGAENVENDVTFKNLLVWYMAERIAREVTEGYPLEEE